MSFGGAKQTTTQTKTPYGAAQPATNQILGTAQDWMSKGGAQYYPGQTYADLTAPQMQGIGTLTNGGNSGDAQSYFKSVINGNYLDPSSNPALQGQLDAVTRNVMPNINASFTKAGMYGGTTHQDSLAQGLSAGLAAPIFQNYANERGMQQAAAGNAPGMNQAIGNQQLQAGGILQADKQAQIDADKARWDYQQNQPLMAAQQAAGLVNPIASQYGSSTQTQTQNASPLQQALGLGMMGASMFGTGGMFPGVGGAAGGYLSNLFKPQQSNPYMASGGPY